MDLVSIIIPIYNSEKYLKQCLNSVCKQSYKNMEVILVDDGSTDDSGKICDEFEKKDLRYKAIHIINQGVSNARNYGIKNANGNYIIFIDSDDWIPKDYVKNLMEENRKEKFELIACPIYGKINKKWEAFSFDFDEYSSEKFIFLNKNYFLYGPHCKLYQTDIIKKNKILFPQDISYGEDLIFNMQYLKYCEKLFVTNRTFYNYRIDNENSLSRKYRDNQFEMEKILHKKLFELIRIKKIKDIKLEKYYYRRYVDVAYNSILKNNKNSFLEKYSYINNILKDSVLKIALKNGNLEGYSKKILYLMRRKSSIILTIISMYSS